MCWALIKGAKHVFGYEPEIQNFKIATHNININKWNEKSTLKNLAVIGNDDKERFFYFNVKRNKALHSLFNKRGRDTIVVQCANINSILKECKPNVIKIDCEGCEYELIKSIKSFKGIREMIIEFHHSELNDKTHEKYKEVTSLLKTKFAHVTYNDNPKGAWVTLIYCKRK